MYLAINSIGLLWCLESILITSSVKLNHSLVLNIEWSSISWQFRESIASSYASSLCSECLRALVLRQWEVGDALHVKSRGIRLSLNKSSGELCWLSCHVFIAEKSRRVHNASIPYLFGSTKLGGDCNTLTHKSATTHTIMDPVLQIFRSKLHRALWSEPFFSILLPMERPGLWL